MASGARIFSEGDISAKNHRINQLETALREILEYVPDCTCHEAYTSRGLTAPDCCYHADGMEQIEAIAQGALKQ